jgi:PAS domain S-box-containing protein
MTQDELISELQRVQPQSIEAGSDSGKPNIDRELEFYQKIFQDSPIGMTIYNSSGQCIKANKSIGEIIGATREQILLQNYFYIESWKRSGLLEAAIKATKTQKTTNKEVTLTSTFGKELSAIGHFLPFSIDKNNYLLFTFDDITQQKRLETELQKSEEKYRQLAEDISAVLWVVSPKWDKLHYINAAYEDVWGKSCQSLYDAPTSWLDSVVAADRPKLLESIENVDFERMEKVIFPEYRIERPDGKICWIQANGYPLKNKNGEVEKVAGIAFDITSQKNAEKNLREKEHFLNIVFDAIQDGISVLDTDFNVIRVNKVLRELYAHMLPFEGKKKCYEVYHGRSEPCEICPTIRTLKSGRLEMNEIPLTLEGEVKGTHELFSFPIVDELGKVTGVVEHVRDITVRKQTEEKIKQQQHFLEKSQELGRIGTWELDLRQNKLYWTDENCRLFGVPAGSVVNYEIFMRKVHPDDREYVDREWNAALNGEPYDIEHRIVVGDATSWVREKADVEFDEEGVAIKAIGFTQDITESKQAEEELEKEKNNLKEVNIALKVLLRESSQTKDDLEENMRTNIKNLLLPYLTELESRLSTEEETFFMDIIKLNIDEITSSFSRKLTLEYNELTPREIQVANFIRQGRTNKEIARLLNITPSAVDFHRRNLRKKFNIKGRKTNLRSLLLSFVG